VYYHFFFLRPQVDEKDESSKPKLTLTKNLFRAVILLKEKKMLFLLPLFFYSGIEQGFVFGSYTSDIISRTLGKGYIGFVMTVFGAVDVIGSAGLGKLADWYGTNIIAIVGFVIHIVFFGLFFVLIEVERFFYLQDNSFLIWIGAAMCGLGDAAWNTFPGTVTSRLYSHNIEAAFAVCKWGQALGTFLTFALGPYLTIEVKLVGFFGFLCIACISFIFMKIFINESDKEELQIQSS
jgi:MFS family permease